MKLSRLLAAAGIGFTEDAEISAITCRSEEVEPGTLFAALEGAKADGRAFIPKAIERGATAVLCRGGAEVPVPVIDVPDPRNTLGLMAAEFYGRPGDAMTLVAVTGTKGKTTVAHMLREILMAAGHKTGMIGTLGAFVGREQVLAALNTTPEPVVLHHLLQQMRERGCSHVVLEVSSQAMKMHRLAGLTFAVGVFLNLSPDHIGPGEHENFWEYRHCKAELFRQCRCAAGNAADPAWPFMAAHVPEHIPVYSFGGETICPGPGLSTVVDGAFSVPMPGRFNGENAAAAIAVSRILGMPDESIRAGLANTAVPGRCEVFPTGRGFDVIVDYAHNGASFAALFSALREQKPARTIAVFGAGGDRSPLRREEMARAAAEGVDFAVITEDNPRSEPVEVICAQIAAAMPGLTHVIIPDRREAIRYALDSAGKGDVVVLLGKGHENYIEANGRKRHFSEREVLEEYFGK